MNYYSYLIFFVGLMLSQTLHSQTLFVENRGWGKEIDNPIPDSLNFKFISSIDSIQKGDTAVIKILYPNGKVAIEGQVVHSRKKLTKFGMWNYYYDNENLWSVREYKRNGRLTAIHKLLSMDGIEQEKGFARSIGKHRNLTGYNYKYDQSGSVSSIVQYSGGQIVNEFAPDRYSDKQLSRIKIRVFEIDEGSYLEELSFEEAFEKQKENGKTILLNASTSWNGWTKKGFKTVFTKNHIAKFIDENFILCYLDIEDTRPIQLETNGDIIVLEGSIKNKQHGLIKKTVSRLGATPTFIFLGPNLEVLHKNPGIEIKEKKFMDRLLYFTSGSYKSMTIKEFENQ